MEEKEYSVSEAVRLIGVESHVLRYWEEELQIAIGRTSQGHRIYSQENIETFRQVKSLKEKGIQLKAIRVLLEENDRPEAADPFLAQIHEIERRTGNQVQETDSESSLGRRKCDGNGKMESQIEELERRLSEAGSVPYDKEEAAQEETETKEMLGKEKTAADEAQNEEKTQENETDSPYELVLPETKPDNLQQFEAIMKQMIAEVVQEQNEKMEQEIVRILKEEIEELYLQYYQISMQEAAAASGKRQQEKKKSLWERLWRRD